MSLFTRAPVVTVGIAAYNALPYLRTCLESIAGQTYGKRLIEVLVIDDGSSDDTVVEARRLMTEHKLKGEVLTQKNTGSPATARNVAIERAQGRWLYFVDVDDYLGKDALKTMVSLGDSEDADVVVGKYVGINRGVPKVMFRDNLAKTDVTKTPLIDSLNVLKMYRTEFARSLDYRFNPALRMAEDHPFALSAYVRTDRVAIVGDTDCYFCVRHISAAAKTGHLTGHVLPVDEFYAYTFEAFEVIERNASAGAPFASAVRDKYWHRLLTLDLPTEMRRNRSAEDRDHSIATAQRLFEQYDPHRSEDALNAKSRSMLRALELGDRVLVENLGQVLR